MKSFALAVDGSELLSCELCGAGSVPALGVRSENEDDSFFGTYETLVESSSIGRNDFVHIRITFLSHIS